MITCPRKVLTLDIVVRPRRVLLDPPLALPGRRMPERVHYFGHDVRGHGPQRLRRRK